MVFHYYTLCMIIFVTEMVISTLQYYITSMAEAFPSTPLSLSSCVSFIFKRLFEKIRISCFLLFYWNGIFVKRFKSQIILYNKINTYNKKSSTLLLDPQFLLFEEKHFSPIILVEYSSSTCLNFPKWHPCNAIISRLLSFISFGSLLCAMKIKFSYTTAYPIPHHRHIHIHSFPPSFLPLWLHY